MFATNYTMIILLWDVKINKTPCLSQFIPPPVEVGDFLLTAC